MVDFQALRKKIMYTCTVAGYNNVNFAVQQKAKLVVVAAAKAPIPEPGSCGSIRFHALPCSFRFSHSNPEAKSAVKRSSTSSAFWVRHRCILFGRRVVRH